MSNFLRERKTGKVVDMVNLNDATRAILAKTHTRVKYDAVDEIRVEQPPELIKPKKKK